MLSQPPRDKNNQVIPHDHTEIPDEHQVIRRISHLQVIEKGGIKRISSIAYKSSSGDNAGMSVDLKQLIEEAGLNPKDFVTNPKWIGSVLLNVVDLRNLNFMVGFNPIEAPAPNPYHGEVWGEFTKEQQSLMQKAAVWFVKIDGVELY